MRGLSQKGPDPGNASYYLSWTRMPLSGTLRLAEGEARLAVRGEGWMDREWSTSALGSMHLGWDWFSLQLDDGRDLMFFELRRDDGLPDPLNHGALVEADGSFRPLAPSEVDAGGDRAVGEPRGWGGVSLRVDRAHPRRGDRTHADPPWVRTRR
jgi:predicted secreted hydrolase